MAEALRVRVLGIIPPTKGELVITITIDTDNAAFEDNPFEMAELLEKLAKSWRLHHDLPESATDSNGNTVCEITLDEESEK